MTQAPHDARFRTPPLSRGGIDRDHAARMNPALLDELVADPRTLALAVSRDRGLLAADGTRLHLSSPRELLGSTLVYLGRSIDDAAPEPAGTPILAAILTDDDASALAPEDRWGSLRKIGARLADRDAALLTAAVAVSNWHRAHRYSPTTGEPLEHEQGGWMLRSSDGREIYPRIDPAVIVAVLDADDRILLGSNALWESTRYSLLAGFVEAGESLEAAVEREIFEESGIRVINPVYVGSQPWPYPQSLMLGFTALADPSIEQTLRPDGDEILDLRWFSRDEIVAADDVMLPGSTSIARSIIEHWLGERIEGHDT